MAFYADRLGGLDRRGDPRARHRAVLRGPDDRPLRGALRADGSAAGGLRPRRDVALTRPHRSPTGGQRRGRATRPRSAPRATRRLDRGRPTAPGQPAPIARRAGDATAIGLRYVSPDGPGIRRRRAGRGFAYRDPRGRPIRDAATLDRIRALAIPPAWTDVWICPTRTATPGDRARRARPPAVPLPPRLPGPARPRKFARLVRFGERAAADPPPGPRGPRRPGLPREKVLAAVVALLELTRFRVGNEEYARLNRSFGLSTLRDRHARSAAPRSASGSAARAAGPRSGELRRPAARGVVRRCQDLPGPGAVPVRRRRRRGARRSRSEDVNDYLRDAAGTDDVQRQGLPDLDGDGPCVSGAPQVALEAGDADAATARPPKRIVDGGAPADRRRSSATPSP